MKEEVSDLRGKFKNNCRIKEYSTHSSKIHSVDWNCDGRRLASGGFDKSVCIVGLSNDRLSKEVCSWQLWIEMRNSEKIKYISGKHEITLIIETWHLIQITYRGHGDSVDQLVWHPSDPDMLATASGDRTVRIWDARVSKAVANISTKVNIKTILLIENINNGSTIM